MVLMFFMALGFTLAMDQHVRVTFIFQILPRKVQNIFWVIIGLAGIFYVSLLGYEVTRLSLDSFTFGVKTETSEMIIFPWQMIAVLGLIVFLVALMMLTINKIGTAVGIRQEKEEQGRLIDLGL